ncbi:LIM domain only protein 7b isoform X3 [Alosa alosa]|uniref:LIM domain only protein 7b isoform X3 n=1 Tax=Alosa alosa TaxID=278164 RepID=UPI0020150FCD|nr:LIM domain only protein 7b isoform X3 [Alosa alosa]
MEWRGQPTVSSAVAFSEAQRWVEEVTEKSFGTNNFRSALENGVLLCDLINKLKPGIIKRVNHLSTPIAGLDNVNVFLKACRKLGLNEAQLFHPGDLQDVSSRVTVRREETNRRLKNVLITLYWLGRKAQADPFYTGPLLNLKAFEGLLGFALSKVLEESCPGWSVRDSGYSEEEQLDQPPASYRREDSVESLDSLESRTLSVASESTLRAGSEGSDAEADQGFRMSDVRDVRGRGYMPTPLRRKRGEQHEDDRTGPLIRLPLRTYVTVGSKSLSDIPLGSSASLTPHVFRSSLTFDISVEAAAAGQLRQEHLRRIQGRIKETEAKWQEDLTRWKDRRRSANSDLHRKREERGLDAREELLERSDQEAFCSSVYTPICYSSHTHTHPHTHHLQQQQHLQQHEADHTHRSRAPLSRGLAVEGPVAGATATSRGPLPPSDPAAQGESLPLGSLPTDLASAPSSSSMPGLSPESPARMPSGGAPPYMTAGTPHFSNGAQSTAPGALKVHWNSPVSSSLTGSPMARPSGPQNPYGAGLDLTEDLQGGGQLYRPGTPAVRPLDGGSRMSSTLPRGFRRSEGSSCLSAGVTPRPFGAKTSRVSMSKLYAKDDSHKSLMSNAKGHALFTSTPAPYGKVATFADFERPSAPPMQSSPRQERRAEGGRTSAGINQSSAPNNQSSAPNNQSSAPNFTASLPDYTSGAQSVEREVLHSDMRVSLNQRPNTGTDFGFQTHWDSTGARITAIQPGSPAELCQLCVGDEIRSVGGHSVGHMSYTQWKDSMAQALAKGNLLMDVRRHGHADWGWSGHPSLPFKSHKTLNLTSADSTLVGRPEHYVDIRQDPDITAAPAAEPLTNGLTYNGVGPLEMNGGFHKEAVTLRNKGGSESAISDLQVPSISAPAGRWSWNPEEDRKKHESWQREQERLLQEKYQRDQQRLEDEWRRAQQEVGGNHGDGLRGPEELRVFEVANAGTPRPFSRQSASSPFVTSNQSPEEEGPVKMREEPIHSADSSPSKEAGLDECDGTTANQWPDDSYSFATLAAADRTKSKSTPTLDSFHQHEDRGAVRVEKKLGQQMSQVEFERQQILAEMRKRTPLNRDSSWIRQRSSSSSLYKEPINPVRRFESLDDLHSGSSWTRPSSATSNPMRPHSAMGSVGGLRGPGRYSMGAMWGAGAAGGGGGGSSTLPAGLSASCLRQGPWARPASTSPTPLQEETSPQRISVSAAEVSCDVQVPDLRCGSETDSCSATAATDGSEVAQYPNDQSPLLQQVQETPSIADP